MITAREEEAKVIREQIAQKHAMLKTLRSDAETAEENLRINQDLYKRHQRLNQSGYASDVKLLETKQALNQIRGGVNQLRNRISMTTAEISEFENRLASLAANYRDDANEKLGAVMAEQQQNAEVISKIKDRVARLEIKAPAHGLIKGLTVNTVGSVIQSGQTVMEIVPLDEELVVQVKIPPQHIGHVKADQKVQVKFSSFDFARYGVVSGRLTQISATTFVAEGGERYYRGLIALDQDYVGHDPRNVVMAGMTVMAEIITGQKTVLDYLLKPIHVAMKTAFTER
jgi:HlyD family secretion protein/adhesin transport system membrane fusion protein